VAVPAPLHDAGGAEGASEALADAVRALGRREYGIAELSTRLEGRGHAHEAVASAVGTLIEEGLLDDRRFARRFAEDKRSLAGWGEERIRGALEARGLESWDIERALSAEDAEQQIARAVKIAQTRLPADCRDTDRQRVLGLLARRGYPLDLSYEAIRRAERADPRDG